MDTVSDDAEDGNGYKSLLFDKTNVIEKARNQCIRENGRNEDVTDDDEDSESRSLLPTREDDVKSKWKKQRKVHWNDHDGSRLAEVLVYEPSDASDSDDDDETDSCFCTIL